MCKLNISLQVESIDELEEASHLENDIKQFQALYIRENEKINLKVKIVAWPNYFNQMQNINILFDLKKFNKLNTVVWITIGEYKICFVCLNTS